MAMIRRGLAIGFGCVLLLGTSLRADRVRRGRSANRGGEPDFRQPGDPRSYVQYGHPMPASLWEIAGGRYARQAVRTRGVLSFADATSGYLELTDKNDQVLVIVVDELRAEARSFVGLRVEVVGLPRALKESQGTCLFLGQTVPQSICDDPHLPALPDLAGHPFWPRTSLTIWSITDVTPLDGRRRDEEEPSLTLRELLDGADTPPRERVTVRGRFCGRNLCGGLSAPAPSRLRPGSWSATEPRVWVVGKPAKGKGWRLDPLSKRRHLALARGRRVASRPAAGRAVCAPTRCCWCGPPNRRSREARRIRQAAVSVGAGDQRDRCWRSRIPDSAISRR